MAESPEPRPIAIDEPLRPATEDLNLERLASLLGPLASATRLKLLRHLTRPHYLEEIAQHLGLTRQAARKHVDQLVEIGVLEPKAGVRDTITVTEYVINPQALFLIYDEFEKLGSLRRDPDRDALVRTVAEPRRGARASATPGSCLLIVRGLNAGRRFGLGAAEARNWTIGRDERCDIVVAHDPYASNRHAEVRSDRGRFVLADLASTNGTQHNLRMLASGTETPLRHGDLIGVGKTHFLFWDTP